MFSCEWVSVVVSFGRPLGIVVCVGPPLLSMGMGGGDGIISTGVMVTGIAVIFKCNTQIDNKTTE